MDSSKTRLRKACDACSIRKVKVSRRGYPALNHQFMQELITGGRHSAIPVAHLVGHVPALISPVPTNGLVDDEGPQTGMPKLLRSRNSGLQNQQQGRQLILPVHPRLR